MKTPVTQRSPYYSAVSALLMNPLPDRSNYSPLCHTQDLTPAGSIVSSSQTLYQAASWRLILQSSMLQRFAAECNRELSALWKLNNKQSNVPYPPLQIVNSAPFSLLSAPFSQSSLFSLSPIPSFSSGKFSVFLR